MPELCVKYPDCKIRVFFMRQKHHIIVGLSGGVDSAVTALLLKNEGHAVEGIFMKNWEDDDTDTYCSAAHDKKTLKSCANR